MDDVVDLSIVIPTFRRERELLNAIRSVLQVTELNIEVLVADDSPEGSAEPLVRQITDCRLRYEIRERATGGVPALVRNDLAQKAIGKVLYFLDDDDTVVSRTLVEMYRKLMASSVGVAIGGINPVGDPDSEVVQRERELYALARVRLQTYVSRYQYCSRLLNDFPMLVCSAAMVKREVFHRVGGFSLEMPLWEDVEFYLRAIRESGYVFVDRILLNRQTGGASLAQDAKNHARIEESFRIMSRLYRQRYGTMEWAILKSLSRLRWV